jgi:hypothetical protein
VTWAVPFFVLFIGIELAALKWLDHDDVSGYQAKDATTSILMGLGSLATTLALKAAAFFVYVALYLYVAPWHLSMRRWWSYLFMPPEWQPASAGLPRSRDAEPASA